MVKLWITKPCNSSLVIFQVTGDYNYQAVGKL